jgi:hypothetical protein
MTHYQEDDLILYYYGEGRRRAAIEKHLDSCGACAAVYREIAGTLRMIPAPEVPERGEQYGLEVWQRIRHQLPEQDSPWWMAWFRRERLVLAAAAASLVLAAFVAGRFWPRQVVDPGNPGQPVTVATTGPATGGSVVDMRQRVVLTSVVDHLDRSERWLTDIMNAPQSDISIAQRWAEDLLTTSRLYRQDAADVGEQSVADVLDEIERSLMEIVHSPSRISAADLELIRRRIDAAALLFKVRVMSEELRQRERAPDTGSRPQTSTRKVS